MNEKREIRERPEVRVSELKCRRTGQMFSPREHAQCPYCFGSEQDIASGGAYDVFCDYREGDPINFGFPPDSSRARRG